MNTKKYGLWIVALLVIVPFVYSVIVYPHLPNQIPIHFNAAGKPDRWGRPESIFLGPGIMGAVSIFIYVLMTNLKSIDPKKFDPSSETLYIKFAMLTVTFLSILSIVIIYATTHQDINVGKIILPIIGIAFSVLGWYMPKFKQNYFVGFKLPWTLENVNNWNATHAVAGKIWFYCGILQAILTALLPSNFAFISFMSLIAIMVIAPTLYSYLMFKNGNSIK